MKFNRKGQYVAVQGKLTWKADSCILYSSKQWGDWIIMEHSNFFNKNKDLVKSYSQTPSQNQNN